MGNVTLPLPLRLGRYSVDRILGRGSTGVVLLGRDPEIDRPVAIKLIQMVWQTPTEDLDRCEARFCREARLAGKLSHPNIVAVFDVGLSEDGAPFIVMEYVDGGTLKQVIEKAPLDMGSIIRFSSEILDALSYAHSRGIVHRDLKPSNVLVGSDQHIKMTDFGISHLVGAEFTRSEELLGTPYYMAPEQLRRGPLDQRCDLFAFGVMLYEMLTGVRPFAGRSPIETSYSTAYDEPVPPDQIAPQTPQALSDLVLRCLAKDREKRIGSAEEIKGSLASILEGRVQDGVQESVAERSTKFLWSLALRRKPVRPVWLALLILVVISSSMLLLLERYGADRRVVTAPAAGTHLKIDRAEQERLLEIALAAFKKGALEESESKTKELLQANPPIAGASELHDQIQAALLEKRLPLPFSATHAHRFGYCPGELTLAKWGIQFSSKQHPSWKWAFQEIRMLEMPDASHITIQTSERDALKLGAYKNYSFELIGTGLASEDRAQYRRLWANASASP